jgi:hypothetical protein
MARSSSDDLSAVAQRAKAKGNSSVRVWRYGLLRFARNDDFGSARATKQPVGQISKSCPVLTQKIFRLTRRANQRYQLARLTRQEGRLAIVTNVR